MKDKMCARGRPRQRATAVSDQWNDGEYWCETKQLTDYAGNTRFHLVFRPASESVNWEAWVSSKA